MSKVPEINDDDVEALMQELMAGANDQPDLSDLSWSNITTQEEHAADYARLIREQKQNDENLRRLNKEANEMSAKYKADEEANKLNPPKEHGISDADLKAMMAEYDEDDDAADKGGKTRHKRSGHKRKQSGYSKKRTHKKKSMNKKKRTYRKKSMNKKKRTYRKKRT